MCTLQTSQDFEAEAEAQEMQNPPKPENTGKPPPQQSSGQGDDGEGEQGEPSEGGNQVNTPCLVAVFLYHLLSSTHLTIHMSNVLVLTAASS